MSLSSLCLACGLCCDGNLFTSVPLSQSEAAALKRLALPVVTRKDGTPGLAQRCAALEGKCCRVYSERPEACRRYRCHLAIALEEGEVSLEEALQVVNEAHVRLRAVEEHPQAWEQAQLHLDRHFRGRHRRGG